MQCMKIPNKIFFYLNVIHSLLDTNLNYKEVPVNFNGCESYSSMASSTRFVRNFMVIGFQIQIYNT